MQVNASLGGYKPRKYNKAQHTLVLLDDQSFTVSRKVVKEKELPKPSFENVISPIRFDLLGCNKNENENLDHREEYKPSNQKGLKVTQPILPEKNSLNSNDGSIVETSVKSIIGTKMLQNKT